MLRRADERDVDAMRKPPVVADAAMHRDIAAVRALLQKGSADGPATGPYMRRLHAETYAVARCLDGLRECLRLWAEAAGAPSVTYEPSGWKRTAAPAS